MGDVILPVAEPLDIRQQVQALVAAQRSYFATGKTRSLPFRRTQLKRLAATISTAQPEIYAALKLDLGKPDVEAFLGELAIVSGDIKYALKHLASSPKNASTSGLPRSSFRAA
ncbi:MAG: hypothetical protein AAFV46_02505 [Cyanobacteria bacterium J06635_11]